MEVSMVVGFDIYRQRKFMRGVNEHRNGDASAPFNGDPIADFYDECADQCCYLEQMARDGCLLSEDILVLDDMVRAIVLRLAEAVARKRDYDAGRIA